MGNPPLLLNAELNFALRWDLRWDKATVSQETTRQLLLDNADDTVLLFVVFKEMKHLMLAMSSTVLTLKIMFAACLFLCAKQNYQSGDNYLEKLYLLFSFIALE